MGFVQQCTPYGRTNTEYGKQGNTYAPQDADMKLFPVKIFEKLHGPHQIQNINIQQNLFTFNTCAWKSVETHINGTSQFINNDVVKMM